MVVGLASGASAGVYARTNNWFGARTNHYVREWADTGYSKEDITRRVFDNLYPPMPTGIPTPQLTKPLDVGTMSHPAQKSSGEKKEEATKGNPPSNVAVQADTPGLFTVPAKECDRLRQARDGTEDELRREMASSTYQQLRDLARDCQSDDCLKNGVKKLCPNL
jgi:hypothetical protein